MSCRGRPGGRALITTAIAIALLSAVPGCAPPIVESTGVFADVWDGRLVLIVNLVRIVENEQRFAIYYSDRSDLGGWTLAGTYGGRARAAAVHEGLLWVFFEPPLRGRPFARTYPLPGGIPEAGTGTTPDVSPRPGRVEELPFTWAPSATCRDVGGALWVAGIQGGRIAVARLSTKPGGHVGGMKAWDSSFPPGPEFEMPTGESPKRTSGSRSRSRDAGTDGGRSVARAMVRISAGGAGGFGDAGDTGHAKGLFVFWSATSSESVAEVVCGARLTLDGPSPRRGGFGHAGGFAWRVLPPYPLPHQGFCAAPSTDGTPGLVLSRYVADAGVRRTIRPHRVEFGPRGAAWSPAEDVSAATQRFFFGYVPRAAWVQWEGGQLLVRTNTQRVEILERSGGEWRAFVPAGFLALYLTEIEVLLLVAGALLLVVVGGTVFGVRMRRMRRPGSLRRARDARGPARPEGLPRIAPISRRIVAAMLDVLVVSGAAFMLVGLPGAPANPLVPDARPLLLHLGALAALAVYGAVTEAAFGATPGKLALGLRVELTGGGRPGVARVIVRNLLRPVDILPAYLGAVGLSLMTMTGLRQRLGDLAAGTVVVTARPMPAPAPARHEDGER